VQNLLLEKQRAELMEEQERMRKEQDELRERNGKANNAEDIQKMKAEQEILNAKMKEYKLAQEAYMRDQSRKANQEMQLELIKQNEQLATLTENIRKRQEELRQEAKSVQQKDYKKQNELLNKQIMELRYEQQQIQKQRLKINEMLLNFNHDNSMVVPDNPDIEPANIVLDGQPVLETVDIAPPVPPVIDNVTVSSVIDDLLEEKVITNQNDLSFTLNNEILKVNGVVQPKELHAKLKEKYIKSKKDHVIYSKHGGSTHTEVSIDN
jgi:DNA repair exonuclease SbcCD ATPase subunit